MCAIASCSFFFFFYGATADAHCSARDRAPWMLADDSRGARQATPLRPSGHCRPMMTATWQTASIRVLRPCHQGGRLFLQNREYFGHVKFLRKKFTKRSGRA